MYLVYNVSFFFAQFLPLTAILPALLSNKQELAEYFKNKSCCFRFKHFQLKM